MCACLMVLSYGLAAALSGGQVKQLDKQFQAAEAQYEAGHFPEAAAQLESPLREAPESFEVHELLGLVYSGSRRMA